MGHAYFRGADVCVLVFDLSERKTFDSLDKWYKTLIEAASPLNPDKFPIVLIGNKSDLPRAVQEDEAKEWCSKHNHCPYFETQAINGVFVESAFNKVSELAAGKDEHASMDLGLPEGLSMAGGAVQLSAADDARRTQQLKDKKSSGGCC